MEETRQGGQQLLRIPIRVERSMLVMCAMGIVLLIGAFLRFQGINWDDGQHLHPDERFLTMVETGIQWPKSLGEYFDTAHSPLNPYNRNYGSFVYGTFPLFLTKLLADAMRMPGYDGVNLVGRALSGLLDLISIWLIFLIGRRLYDVRVGLLGAALLAFSAFNIQQSHFFTADMPTNLMIVLAMYFAINVSQGGGWRSAVGLGLAFGLAVASKINVALFVVIIGLAFALRFWALGAERGRVKSSEGIDREFEFAGWSIGFRVRRTANAQIGNAQNSRWTSDRLIASGGMAAASLLIALLVFRIAQPYAFAGPGFFDISLSQKWLQDMGSLSSLISGKTDYPPGDQWAFRMPYLFPWLNMVQWGLGWPLGLAAWAGTLLAGWEIVARQQTKHLLPVAWIIATFGYLGGGFVLTMRYFLPIYPFLALSAAYLLIRLWDITAKTIRGRDIRDGLASTFSLRSIPFSPLTLLAAGLVAIVLVGTFLWAVAFTEIYRQPVSRVTASRWIYQNVPPGAAIGWEHWDDPLPLRIDGKDGGTIYKGVELPMYAEDTREKLYGYPNQPKSGLLDKLDQADWIFISSNRLYGSIPRLPMRFPMTTKYYQALFSGELGFERVKTFNSFPSLFGWEFNDQGAEEAFTVYDHPQVDIFRKTSNYSRQKAEALLGSVDWDNIQRLSPLVAMRAGNGLMLGAGDREIQQQGGTWSKIFGPANAVDTGQFVAFILWWLDVELIGLLAFPLGFVVMRKLYDCGWILSKTLGLLLCTYFVWLLASLHLLTFTRGSIFLGLLVLAALAGLIAVLQRAHLQTFLREHWRIVILEEAWFLLFFALFVLIRMGNPDLWHPVAGGEKPMDFAFLNAVIRSTYFPPYDPWYAGGYMNYYYFGFVIVASLIKLTDIVPWIAYNLAVPLMFALTAMGAFSIVFNLVAARGRNDAEGAGQVTLKGRLRVPFIFGIAGAMFVSIIGNLGEAKLYLDGLAQVAQSSFRSQIPGVETLVKALVGLEKVVVEHQVLPFRPEWPYWNATRTIPDTINEFPFFTFLYGDLHAHMMALPLTLLALALALALVFDDKRLRNPASDSKSPKSKWAFDLKSATWYLEAVQLAVLALAVGVLWPANTWDFPTYLLIALAALGLEQYRRRGQLDWSWLVGTAWRFVIVLFLSRLLFQPFFASYGAAYTTLEIWHGQRTQLPDYLIVHGFFLFVLTTWLIYEARFWLAARFREIWPEQGRESGWSPSLYVAAVAAIALLVLMEQRSLLVPMLDLVLIGLCVVVFLKPDLDHSMRFAVLLIALGLGLSLGVEVVVLQGDIGRMNTVFKFYLQIWVLWGVATAFALANVLPSIVRWSQLWRRVWLSAFIVLIAATLAYPVLATMAKVQDRFTPASARTLDGRAYMESAIYQDKQPLELDYDRAGIDWLLDSVNGSPVILEGNTPEYRWGSRFSVYTGLPSVVGWNWHERQQRALYTEPLVERRIQDVATMYNTLDPGQALSLLRKYGVNLIIVGGLEKVNYQAEGLAKFDRMVGSSLEVVYANAGLKIYRVSQN